MMGGWGHMMRGWGRGSGLVGNGNFWWLGLAMMAIRFVITIAIIVIAIRWFRSYSAKAQQNNQPRNNALEILRERYAKGEIDTEEFNRRKEDLTR